MLHVGNDFYKAYVCNWLKEKNLFYSFKLNSLNELIIKINKNGKTVVLKK